MSAPVEICGLTRVFANGVRALQRIDLSVAAGEFVTLLGPSGSGKSTILKIIAGVDQPTAGAVSIGGRPVLNVPTHKRDIGMVFQNYALFPHMTVWDNVAFPLSVRNCDAKETRRRVERVLALTQLSELGGRRPGELSGGQQQRVALARAVVFEPHLLLMDEPLGALDRHLREQLKFEIKRVQRELGVTVLFVTHDQGEALAMSDRIVVMRDGRIEQVATPQEVYAFPVNRFVAGFVGEANLLPCICRAGKVMFRDAAIADAARPQLDGECWAMIRPNRLKMGPATAAERLDGVVRSVDFEGETRRYQIDLDGIDVVARSPTHSGFVAQAGERVTIDWAREDAVILFD